MFNFILVVPIILFVHPLSCQPGDMFTKCYFFTATPVVKDEDSVVDGGPSTIYKLNTLTWPKIRRRSFILFTTV